MRYRRVPDRRKAVKKMNLIDILDIYSLSKGSEDMFLLLSDYPLDERIDRDVLNRVILKDLGSTRPITTDPDMFKILLDTFFEKYSFNITRLVDTMYIEYNPMNTKDMTETEHRHSTGDIDNTDKYDTNTDNQQSGSTTDEKLTSAMDVSTYQPKEKNITTPSTRVDNDVHHEGETTSDIESTVDADKRVYGKDGYESYQSLLEQERKVNEFNIFNWIISQMRKELFLLVY